MNQKCLGLVLLLLTACSQQNANKINSAEVKWENLPEACQMLVKQLEHCAVSRISQKEDIQKMSAVLLEQLSSKPVTEQSKTCQDVNAFWQKACGVTK